MDSGSCQCEILRMYLPFNMYMICVLFVLRHSFLSHYYFCEIFSFDPTEESQSNDGGECGGELRDHGKKTKQK